MISKLKKRYFDFCVNCKLRRDSFYRGYSSFIMCLLGVGLLIYGFSDFSIASGAATVKKPIEYDDFYIKRAVCTLYAFIEGSFGALLAVVAGIGAIVSSAFGGYKSAISFIVVSCGSFILRALVSLFFGTLEHCTEGDTTYVDIKLPSGGGSGYEDLPEGDGDDGGP